MAVNLIPFPRLHFLMIGIAPMTLKGRHFESCNTRELSLQLLDSRNILCAADPRHGRFLTASAIFRGKISPQGGK